MATNILGSVEGLLPALPSMPEQMVSGSSPEASENLPHSPQATDK